jgi:putative ATP-dependent endonuclease of OLD family
MRFALIVEWPPHLLSKYAKPEASARSALDEYFARTKGSWSIADFIAQCAEEEIPEWLRNACVSLVEICSPAAENNGETYAAAASGANAGAQADAAQ